MDDAKRYLIKRKYEMGLYELDECSAKEVKELKALNENDEPLPPDVFYNTSSGRFFKYCPIDDMTENELSEYMLILLNDNISVQVETLRAIKKDVHFFVILGIIGIIAAVVLFLINLS